MANEAGSRPARDLVYDIGMHHGEDTAYYLAKGYRVVAFEAHPELARESRERFADAIASGSLTVVEGAISEQTAGSVTFYLDSNSLWGSIDQTWVRKKQVMRSQKPISVAAVDLAACLQRYGVPHYMKIDIEGADRLCLEALRTAPALPAYISMEAEIFDFAALAADLALLDELGYRRFAVVRQGEQRAASTRTLSGDPLTHRFASDSSGPFGEDLHAAWRSRRMALLRYRLTFWLRALGPQLPKSRLARLLLGPIWQRSSSFRKLFTSYYDTHAKR